MPRLMSVAYTEDAVRERRKTVTRRKGWWEDSRDGADAYARNKPVPNPADIPADYLAAITSWIARNLR